MLAAADLGLDGGELLLDFRLPLLRFSFGVGEDVSDEVRVAVKAGELVDDGLFELPGGEPFVVAGFRSVLLPAAAGVVGVLAAVAARAHPDVRLAATSAAQHAGEQELARVSSAAGDVFAALGEDRLRQLERLIVDEWFVDRVEELFTPAHLPGVGRVAEDEVDAGMPPARSGRRRVLGAELLGDLDRAEPITRVQPEDPLHDRRLHRIGDQPPLLVGERVAERRPARVPASLFRPAFDAGGDAVDDRRVLKLREHAEHLQHHPARSRPGVERLCRRPQDDAELVQLLGELRKLTHLPAQAVDAVDEQHVHLTVTGEVERCLETRPVELRPGRAVLLMRHDTPVFLRRAERLQPLPLRVQRRWLVLLIRRDPRVQTDPDHDDTTSFSVARGRQVVHSAIQTLKPQIDQSAPGRAAHPATPEAETNTHARGTEVTADSSND